MKARSRSKLKGRREGGSYFALPHAVIRSESFNGLSGSAVRLLCHLGEQYRGGNNGDLAAAWSRMSVLGWRSRDTLSRAIRELLESGLIELTRQGGLNRCSLYALTWHAIDRCGGKLDIPSTSTPSGLWKDHAHRKNASTEIVLARHGNRVSPHFDPAALTRKAG